jgi:hypothetical protein
MISTNLFSYPLINRVVSQTSSTKNTGLIILFIILGLVCIGIGYYMNKIKKKSLSILGYSLGGICLIGLIIILFLNPPPTPTNIMVANGSNQVTVSFTGSGSSYTVVSSPGNIKKTGSSSPIIVTGLTNGTSYTFTVTASNLIGTSAPSAPTNPVIPVPNPLIPTNISAVAGNASAIVSFTPNGTNSTSFVVTSSPGNISATGTSSPITVYGLTNGTSYTFTVRGVHSSGSSAVSSPSNEVTPTAYPSAPTNVVATPGNASASIAFTASSGATSYTVTSSPGGLTATGVTSPIVITGLTNGTSYTFTVSATNANGTSPASSSSTSVTPVGLSWKPSVSTCGSANCTFQIPELLSGGPADTVQSAQSLCLSTNRCNAITFYYGWVNMFHLAPTRSNKNADGYSESAGLNFYYD